MSEDFPLHLLSVWNPSYADDAMDQHLEELLGWAERRDRGEAEEDEVYVWWGKLRSPRREQALPHREEVLALGVEARSEMLVSDFASIDGRSDLFRRSSRQAVKDLYLSASYSSNGS